MNMFLRMSKASWGRFFKMRGFISSGSEVLFGLNLSIASRMEASLIQVRSIVSWKDEGNEESGRTPELRISQLGRCLSLVLLTSQRLNL